MLHDCLSDLMASKTVVALKLIVKKTHEHFGFESNESKSNCHDISKFFKIFSIREKGQRVIKQYNNRSLLPLAFA